MKRFCLPAFTFAALSSAGVAQEESEMLSPPPELDRPVVLSGLSGVATGGTLIVVDGGDYGLSQHFQVTTAPGETAASVAARLMEQIVTKRGPRDGTPLNEASRNVGYELSVRFPEAWGGTETGLGFTDRPRGLTGFADWQSTTIRLNWELPPNLTFDSAVLGGFSASEVRPDSASHSWQIRSYAGIKFLSGFQPGQMSYHLWGIKDGIPSAPASIWVDNCLFREATDPPPSAGLHPNWGRFEIPGQPTPTLDRGEDPPYVRPTGTIMVDGEPRDAREVFPFKPWHESPEKKQGYQKVLMPSGATALYRPVVGQAAGDRFEASLLLRLKERASLGENWFVDVLAWNGAPEALEAEVARHARERLEGVRPDITGRGFIPMYTSASTPPETEDWFEVSSAAATGPEGIVIRPGGTKWTLVVVAGNLGGAELGTDWLTVKKLNCSDQIPEGYDPW